MFTTRSNNGNYIFLRMTGTPDDVRQGATRLFNYGVLATLPALPDDNCALPEVSVIATTYRANFQSGFQALAHDALTKDRARTAKMKGRPNLFRLAVEADAMFLMGGIPMERGIQKADDGARVVTGPNIDEDDTGEGLTPATRKLGREILAHWFGASRDAVTGRNPGFED